MAKEKISKTTKTKKAKIIEDVDEIEDVEEIIQTKKSNEPKKEFGNMVYVGKKGVMAYVLAVVTQFGEGADVVTVKARGKSISRAVDVAEISRNQHEGIKLKGIDISTEEVTTEDGRPLKISAIAIQLTK